MRMDLRSVLRTHRWNLVGLKSQLAVAVAMHTTSMGASMGTARRGVCGIMRREIDIPPIKKQICISALLD